MPFWFWIIMAVIAFTFITIVRKWHDYSMLFTIAIGFAVNANIFNSGTVPMYLGNIVFSIDSILYTGFMFVVIICAREYGVRKAKILTSSCIAAILLSAVIEFLANISSFGYQTSFLISSLSYLYSALGVFAGVWIMLLLYKHLDTLKTNVVLNFVFCTILTSIINTSIYYGLMFITLGDYTTVWEAVLGSFIGKVICIVLGLISYYINTHYWIPNDLKYKYVIKSCDINDENLKKENKD